MDHPTFSSINHEQPQNTSIDDHEVTRESGFELSTPGKVTIAGGSSIHSSDEDAYTISGEYVSRSLSPASPKLPPAFDATEEAIRDVTPASPAALTMSERLRQLTTTTWSLEQEENVTDDRRQKINSVIRELEVLLHGEVSSSNSENIFKQDDAEDDGEEDFIDEQELRTVHESLQDTVRSMRLRTQEQKHLHALTFSKLEAAEKQALTKSEHLAMLETQIVDAHTESSSLRRENRVLGMENDSLRSANDESQAHIKALEAEVQRQSIALVAMNSAVTGLEEWINSNHSQSPTDESHHVKSHQQWNETERSTPSRLNGYQPRSGSRSKTIVRGKGRFRGRYQVDVDDDGGDCFEAHHHNFPYGNGAEILRNQDSSSLKHDLMVKAQARSHQLEDDVRSWIRGCRDVLDCATAGENVLASGSAVRETSVASGHGANDGPAHGMPGVEDEWGDFQIARNVP